MSDELVDGRMIEIGDPAEEPALPVPAPRVVIEYRDRGVPWMLIPPLLVLAAVGAVMAYPLFTPRAQPDRKLARSAPAEHQPLPVDPTPEPEVPEGPEAVEPPAAPAPAPVATKVEPAPVIPVEPVPPPRDEAPFPRVTGLGFDPKALNADRDPGPPVDPALAPAAGPPGDEPAAAPAGRDQPEEVDPGLLPPDPKQARARRERRALEAKRQADADRAQFHADLRAICRRLGSRGGPEIAKLCKQYGGDVDPAAKQSAVRLLGQGGSHEGAGRAIRINLLRSLGFPEPTILGDLVDNATRWESHVNRDGLAPEEALYHSAVLLLGFPPNRVAKATRPVSTVRPSPLAPSGPSR